MIANSRGMAGPLRVLVTGASSGIGAAIARDYARRGAQVALLARRREPLEEVAAACRADGGEASVLVCDVTQKAEVAAAVGALAEQWPRIDRAVLNAGVAWSDGARSFAECCTSDAQNAAAFDAGTAAEIMTTNYLGAVYFLEPVLAWMRQGSGGRIAFTGSMAADGLLERSGPYVASKAALRALVEGMRPDACALNIGLTLLEPGFVETGMTEGVRYRMPFLISAERAAEAFVRGIEDGKDRVRAPWQMSALVGVARLVPAPLRALGVRWLGRASDR